MKYDMRTDPVVIEIDKRLKDEFPIIENSKPDVFMKWNDVCNKYPHCWVLLDNMKFTEHMGIIGGIVKHISYYKEPECEEYRNTHRNCLYMYTSDGDGRNFSLFYGYE